MFFVYCGLPAKHTCEGPGTYSACSVTVQFYSGIPSLCLFDIGFESTFKSVRMSHRPRIFSSIVRVIVFFLSLHIVSNYDFA